MGWEWVGEDQTGLHFFRMKQTIKRVDGFAWGCRKANKLALSSNKTVESALS